MSTGIGVYHFKIVGKSFQRRLSKTAKGSKKTFYYLKIVGKSWSAFLMQQRIDITRWMSIFHIDTDIISTQGGHGATVKNKTAS